MASGSDVPLTLENVNAEAMASQALLTGLFIGLRKQGLEEVVRSAFEFAEDSAVAHSYQETVPGAAAQGTMILSIITQLRRAVLP
jgi:hypothetical protein